MDYISREKSRVTKHPMPHAQWNAHGSASYGGPAPRVSGSVVMDLHKMNQIIEVNDHFNYCVVEPGVTFMEIYDHIRQHKLKVWPSAPSLGWGSIIGNVGGVP